MYLYICVTSKAYTHSKAYKKNIRVLSYVFMYPPGTSWCLPACSHLCWHLCFPRLFCFLTGLSDVVVTTSTCADTQYLDIQNTRMSSEKYKVVKAFLVLLKYSWLLHTNVRRRWSQMASLWRNQNRVPLEIIVSQFAYYWLQGSSEEQVRAQWADLEAAAAM